MAGKKFLKRIVKDRLLHPSVLRRFLPGKWAKTGFPTCRGGTVIAAVKDDLSPPEIAAAGERSQGLAAPSQELLPPRRQAEKLPARLVNDEECLPDLRIRH